MFTAVCIVVVFAFVVVNMLKNRAEYTAAIIADSIGCAFCAATPAAVIACLRCSSGTLLCTFYTFAASGAFAVARMVAVACALFCPLMVGTYLYFTCRSIIYTSCGIVVGTIPVILDAVGAIACKAVIACKVADTLIANRRAISRRFACDFCVP